MLTHTSYGMRLVICMAQPWTGSLLMILNHGRHLRGPLQMHLLHSGLVQMFLPTMQSVVGWKSSCYDFEVDLTLNVLLLWLCDCCYETCLQQCTAAMTFCYYLTAFINCLRLCHKIHVSLAASTLVCMAIIRYSPHYQTNIWLQRSRATIHNKRRECMLLDSTSGCASSWAFR